MVFYVKTSYLKYFVLLHYVEHFQKWENYCIERAELLEGKRCQKQKLKYIN